MGATQPHVGLNLIFLVPGETGGMETYARELIPELLNHAPPEMRLTAFINREAYASGDSFKDLLPTRAIPVNARSRAQWVLGEQTLLPVAAARAGVDVMHSLGSTAPLWGRFRRVVTIHDLIYARFPEAHPGIRDRGMKVLVPWAARRADRVIADSHSTRHDLVSLLGMSCERVDVVPLGVAAPREQPLAPSDVRGRFDLDERRVVLSLSAKRPHKNIAALIAALGQLPVPDRPLLVLPGYPTWHERELRAAAERAGVGADVRWPRWLSGPELEGLWAIADCFVFPSLYEGFGLPILEAMARGVPVACSNVASLPELAGNAALLFDPHDQSQIAHALRGLLEDPVLRERLVALGRERARQFTWQRTARLTLETYARVLNEA